MASAHARSGDWNNGSRHHMDHRDYRQAPPPDYAECYFTQRGAQMDNRGAPAPEIYDEASHPVDYYEASTQKTRSPLYSQSLPRAAQNMSQRHNVSGPYVQPPPNVTVHPAEGPDVMNHIASQSTHADDPSQFPPSTMSACTVSQQSTSSSQSLALNQGTPGKYMSSSGMTQHACSLPVSDLFMTPRDQTALENPPLTIKEIKQELKKWIAKMAATNNQVVDGNRNAGEPYRAFAVEKINVLQPGRSQGQPRDQSRTSDGSGDEDSTLRLEIQSSARCVVVKAVPVTPTPVAVVPPLESELPFQPGETEARVHGSTEGGLLSVIDKNGKVSKNCRKSIVTPDDSPPKKKLCGKSFPERLLAAHNWINKDLSAVGHPLANKLSVHTESQIGSRSHVILAEGSYVSEDFNEANESFAVIDYTLSDLRKLIARLKSSSVPQVNKENVIAAILNCFWGGDIRNLMCVNYPEFRREMAALKADALKALDENRVVLRAVDGINLEEFLAECPSLTHCGSSSSEMFRSSWLNVNEKVDDIDQEPGVAWPLCFTPETAEAETRSNKHAIDTETSDVEMKEVVEMEKGRKTDMETEIWTDMKMEAQTKTETGVERNKQIEAVMEGPSHNETERVDITPESTIATETPGSDEEPGLDSLCDIKITLMSSEDAKKLFDQLQNDSTLLIDFSVPISENKGQPKTGLNEEGIVGQEEHNAPDVLSVEEEAARLENDGLERSFCCPPIGTPDTFELGLCTNGLSERRGRKGGPSGIQGGGKKGLHNIQMPGYFSLSVESVNSDQGETEELNMEPKSHAKAQDMCGDWTEHISPGDLTIDSVDEFDVIHLSDVIVNFDREEPEAVSEEPNEQTEPQNLHREHAQPIVPGFAIGITNETEASVLKPFRQTASRREKLRMRDLTKALHHLRGYLPPSVVPAGQTLTKIEILRLTIWYISYLSAQLGLSEEGLSQRSTGAVDQTQLQTRPHQTQYLDQPPPPPLQQLASTRLSNSTSLAAASLH